MQSRIMRKCSPLNYQAPVMAAVHKQESCETLSRCVIALAFPG